jgi:hypothetical protein
MLNNEVYLLHANCFFAKGYLRNCIFDLDRGKYHFVPKDVLVDGRTISIPEKYRSIINLLKNQEIVFVIDKANSSLFTDYNKFNTEPLDLHSIIIEVRKKDCIKILKSSLFSTLTIDHLVIYVKNSLVLCEIIHILEHIKHFRIKSAILLLDYDCQFVEQIPKYTFLEKIVIFNKNKDFLIKDKLSYMNAVEYKIKSSTKHNSLFFSRELFFESLHYNNYINKKIIINSEREVVLSIGENNDNSYKKVLFTISKELERANVVKYLSHPEYKKLNAATKDQTLICQDCELRYVCVDKRQLYQAKSNKYWLHKDECRYNPYIAKWSDEVGYKTLKECGIKINETVKIDSKKLALINRDLWE